MKKYSEQIIRHQAINDEGRFCEVLERITLEMEQQTDGSLGEASVFNRRFDLRTGEPLIRLSDTEFEDSATGARLRLQDWPQDE